MYPGPFIKRKGKNEMSEIREEWIVGIGGSDVDGVIFYRATGTEAEMKQILFDLVSNDRKNDPGAWEFGTESADEVESDAAYHPINTNGDISGRGLYAYGCYAEYHIDYQAIPMSRISKLDNPQKNENTIEKKENEE